LEAWFFIQEGCLQRRSTKRCWLIFFERLWLQNHGWVVVLSCKASVLFLLTFVCTMSLLQVVFKKERHRNSDVLAIYAPNEKIINSIVRKLSATYSVTKKMWWLPWSKEVTNTAYRAFKGKAMVDYSALKKLKVERDKEKEENQPSQDLRGFGNPGVVPTASTQTNELRKRGRKNPLKDYAWTEEQKQVQPVGFF